jgi:hypothetical protein
MFIGLGDDEALANGDVEVEVMVEELLLELLLLQAASARAATATAATAALRRRDRVAGI